MLSVIGFQDALVKAQAYGKKHLVLGNGFSIACRPSIFTYGSLFEKAKINMSADVIKIFETLHTQDFEEVIRALQSSAKIIGAYDAGLHATQLRIAADAERLKGDLITAVAGNHPARPYDITDSEYSYCRTFLSHFLNDGKVYTFNYDLLLYWTLMHRDEQVSQVELKHDDGFRKDVEDYDAEYVEWQGEGASQQQNIHYLHGALHLFDAGKQLQKYTWINSGKALIDQANEALRRNSFPLFVAEGHTDQKREKIMHNAYLHHNLKSFASVCTSNSKDGCALFFFGHSFAENDNHVLHKIGRGKTAHLFVSLFGDPDSAANTQIRGNVDRIKALRSTWDKPLEVTYYDAASAEVWKAA